MEKKDFWLTQYYRPLHGFLIREKIESDGDCFFSCVSIAYSEYKKKKYPPLIFRKHIAKSITQEQFDFYKIIHEAERDPESEIWRQKTGEFEHASFISTVSTLEDFKAFVLTKNYFADELAIDLLEKKLNLKFLIFSIHHVTERQSPLKLCDIPSITKKTMKIYSYVMLEQDKNHYNIIRYGGKSLFSFSALPSLIQIELHLIAEQNRIKGITK